MLKQPQLPIIAAILLSVVNAAIAQHASSPSSPEASANLDWPRRLGPYHNATVRPAKLIETFPKGGPKILWEYETGEGYAAPVIVGDRLVFFHRIGNRATVDCLHPKTGKRLWRKQYEMDYSDRYGFSGGPRCSPLIDGDHVYVYGVEGELRCMKLADGSTVWRTNTLEQFGGKQEFFGAGAGPLIEGDLLILNVGAPEQNAAVVAFNKRTGDIVWKVGDEWGASYASAVPATINGRRVVLVFAGGDSRPAVGGLLVIDPADGKLLSRYPFRSKTYESVNASSPVVWNEKVFISSSYKTGGVLLEFDNAFNAKPVWKTHECGSHFMTPVVDGDYLYAIDGRKPRDNALTCIDFKTGKSMWRWLPVFDEEIKANGEKRTASFGIGLGSLLKVGDRFLLLGENGHLLLMKLSPEKHDTLARAWLFCSQDTWALPPLVDGLLYVNQNQRDSLAKTKPRMICYDLRQETKP